MKCQVVGKPGKSVNGKVDLLIYCPKCPHTEVLPYNLHVGMAWVVNHLGKDRHSFKPVF